jgi:hypothetical protein
MLPAEFEPKSLGMIVKEGLLVKLMNQPRRKIKTYKSTPTG